MESYLPQFDWNNGDQINPWDWLWDDEDRLSRPRNRVRVISIRKKQTCWMHAASQRPNALPVAVGFSKYA